MKKSWARRAQLRTFLLNLNVSGQFYTDLNRCVRTALDQRLKSRLAHLFPEVLASASRRIPCCFIEAIRILRNRPNRTANVSRPSYRRLCNSFCLNSTRAAIKPTTLLLEPSRSLSAAPGRHNGTVMNLNGSNVFRVQPSDQPVRRQLPFSTL